MHLFLELREFCKPELTLEVEAEERNRERKERCGVLMWCGY